MTSDIGILIPVIAYCIQNNPPWQVSIFPEIVAASPVDDVERVARRMIAPQMLFFPSQKGIRLSLFIAFACMCTL